MRELNRDRSQSGFSTIEVLIAIGVLSILLAAGVSAFQYNYQKQVEVDSRSFPVDLIRELKQSLANRRYCTANWKGIAFSASDPNGITPPAPRYFNIDLVPPQPQGQILTADGAGNLMYGKLKVESLTLVPEATLKPDLVAARLTVRLARTRTLGPSSLSRSFPIWLRLQGGNIEECSAFIDTNEEIADRTCKITHEGLWRLDENGQCVPQYTAQWFTGTRDAASCPAGFKFDRTAPAETVCSAQAPAGFIFPEVVPRTFANTGTRYFGPAPFMTQSDGVNTCTCSYFVSASIAVAIDTTGFVCKISCYPDTFRPD